MPGANSNQLIQFQLGGQIIGSNNVLTQTSGLATDTMNEHSGMLQYAIVTRLLLRHGGGGMTA